DQGKIVHYAVETAPILDAAGTCGTFTAGASTDNTSTSVNVPQNTCVRLLTTFGRVPQFTGTPTAANAREGKMGDIGYLVRSATSRTGATPLGNQAVVDSATKKGTDVTVASHTGSELNTPPYPLHGIAANGKDSVLGTVACTACSSGLGG